MLRPFCRQIYDGYFVAIVIKIKCTLYFMCWHSKMWLDAFEIEVGASIEKLLAHEALSSMLSKVFKF